MVSEAFRWSHLVLASATYNNGLFTPMENLLLDLKAHNFQNRTVALMENGSWAPQAGKLMREAVDLSLIHICREGSLGIGRDNIQRAIERAVGADIL